MPNLQLNNLVQQLKLPGIGDSLHTGMIFQDKFLLILLPFLLVVFKPHFVNNHDKHSLVFDIQY